MVISCGSGDAMAHLADGAVDVVVMDPPYYDNVMYGELSDFFYVWLKRTAGLLYPDLFIAPLTDKQNEAVANPALHRGQKGAKALAGLDYQRKMAAIFSECRRVLKADGVMTLMFTHKATGAWDALTKGLMDAGFAITASWPINTEAEGSLHIKDKSGANSTVLLVCRPRPARDPADGVQYWEDLEPRLKAAVRQRITRFQAAGIRGVDLYLSCFGPALEEFSRHWPIKRGQPRPMDDKPRRRVRVQLTPDAPLADHDPYAVTPDDALDAAQQLVRDNGLARSPDFLTALEAVLEVLPLSARYTGFDPVKAALPAASDFEALENLRRLAFAEQVGTPRQLELALGDQAAR